METPCRLIDILQEFADKCNMALEELGQFLIDYADDIKSIQELKGANDGQKNIGEQSQTRP